MPTHKKAAARQKGAKSGYDLKHKESLLRYLSNSAKSTLHILAEPYSLALLFIMALAIFLSFSFFYGPSPINGCDNYLYTDFGYYLSIGNLWRVAEWGVLAQQYILDVGIAFFFKILGPSRFSASLFGELCFLLNIFVLYKMGSLLYNRKAGVFAAFFYSFIPVAVINSVYVGDNGPMALFATLCVYFLAKAIKNKGKQRRNNYLLSGFFGLINLLVTSEGIIILIVPAIVLLAYLIKDRNLDSIKDAFYFALGVLAAFAIIAFIGFALFFKPLYIFSLNFHIYSSSVSPQPSFSRYVLYLFPFNLAQNFNNLILLLHNEGIGPAYNYLRNWLFNASTFDYQAGQGQIIGLIGYATVLAVLYLFVRRNLSFWLPALWLVSTMLYLGYGTVSLTKYIPIGYNNVRFMLLFVPSLALIVGIAAADIVDFGKDRAKHARQPNLIKAARYLLIFLLVATTLVLFINSVLAIRFISLSEYSWIYNLIVIGKYVENLPSNATIYSNYPIAEYARFSRTFYMLPLNCSQITKGSYVVLNYNETYASKCNLVPVFQPKVPNYLLKYNLFANNSWGTFFNTTVYYRN
jgi:4-amino-4-deoxy-L-arabinose transferase-like glycosyltransferase